MGWRKATRPDFVTHAERTLRNRSGKLRPDVLEYCRGLLEWRPPGSLPGEFQKLSSICRKYLRWIHFCAAMKSDHMCREPSRLQDVRRKGIRFGGDLISFGNGHVQVRIDDETYGQVKAEYVIRLSGLPVSTVDFLGDRFKWR